MLRSPDNQYEVAWVPSHQLKQALDVFKEFIYEGVENEKYLSLGEIINDLFKGATRLGIIYTVDPFEPQGCWFSDLRIDDETNQKFVTIFDLAGRNPNKWGLGIAKLVEEWGSQEDCYSMRCHGRLGWLKYGNNVKLLRAVNSREGLLEKVIVK